MFRLVGCRSPFGDIIPLIQPLPNMLIQSKWFIALHVLFHVI